MLITNQADIIRGVTIKSWACPCCSLPVLSKVRGELSGVRLPPILRGRRRLGRPGLLISALWSLEPSRLPAPWLGWAFCELMLQAAAAPSSNCGARLAGGASNGTRGEDGLAASD